MKTPAYIRGSMPDCTVSIDGRVLDPKPSLKLRNHSPDGFNWGYAGSGPSQLALAILLHLTSQEFALANYQTFKFEVVSKWPSTGFSFPLSEVMAWAEAHGWKGAK